MARISGRAVARGHRVPARLLHARRDRDSAGGPSRSLGYGCKVEHPIGDSDLLHIPIGLQGGFGELGRTARSSIRSWARCSGWAASRRRWSSRSITRSTPASQSSATPAAPAGSCPPQAIPDERSPEAGRITSATTAMWSTPDGASPTSRSIPTVRSAFRSASTTTRSGHAISRRASPRNCFPKVIMLASPPPAGSRRRQRVPSVSEAQSFMRLLIAVAPVALVLCAAPGIVAPVSAQPGTASLSGSYPRPAGHRRRQPR